MSDVTNKYKLGLFVVIAVVIFVIFLFLLGSFQYFRTKISCYTVVSSSVQGLSVGAPVKYNGVAIGQVDKIKVSPSDDNVYIYMTVYPDALYSSEVNGNEFKFDDFIKSGVKNGLRCQLRYAGITGSLYQEIRYFAQPDDCVKSIKSKINNAIYIPSVQPILFGDIISKINNSLEKLSALDKIFVQVSDTLSALNKYLNGPQLAELIDEVTNISKNINDISVKLNDTLTTEKINNILSQIDQILVETKKLSLNLNEQITDAKIPETTQDARNLMKDTIQKINSAIGNFNETSESIRNLTETIKNQPDSIIWGKEKIQVVPTK